MSAQVRVVGTAPLPVREQEALELALGRRAAELRLEPLARPGAWQRAALRDGVERRPDAARRPL